MRYLSVMILVTAALRGQGSAELQKTSAVRMQASIDKQLEAVRKQTGAPSGAFYTTPWLTPSPSSAAVDVQADCEALAEDQLRTLIGNAAQKEGVNPLLIRAVIRRESGGRPCAVSDKGAQGLMQIMPATQQYLGVDNPFDPAENIRGGTQYLKELLTMFNGRVDLALASYNAGEGRVLDYGNRVPPFKETRDYVKRISSRYENHVGRDDVQPVAKPPRRPQ